MHSSLLNCRREGERLLEIGGKKKKLNIQKPRNNNPILAYIISSTAVNPKRSKLYLSKTKSNSFLKLRNNSYSN